MGVDDASVADAPTSTSTSTSTGTSTGTMPHPTPRAPDVIINDCAPNDGPAFRLRVTQGGVSDCTLTPPMGSYDEITAWQSLPMSAVATSVVVGKNGEARSCVMGKCTDGVSATIQLKMINANLATGVYTIVFPNASAKMGTFAAVLCTNPAMCG
jgi:hypothetical protein